MKPFEAYSWTKGTGYVGVIYCSLNGFKQQKPYDLPTPYYSEYNYLTRKVSTGYYANKGLDQMNFIGILKGMRDMTLPESKSCFNSTYFWFKDAIMGPQSEVGTSLVEFGKSAKMIATRTRQMRKSLTAIGQGKFEEAAYELGLSGIPSGPLIRKYRRNWFKSGASRRYYEVRRGLRIAEAERKRRHQLMRVKARDIGGLWLEYWMGWAPMVGEICTELTRLDNLAGVSEDISAQTSRPFQRVLKDQFGNTGSGYTLTGKVSVRIGARVSVTNPMLHKLDQMGLVNPLVVAFDISKWSYLVNFVLPVRQYLAGLTDFTGCTLDRIYVTTKAKATAEGYAYRRVQAPTGEFQYSYEGAFTRRTVDSLPMPFLWVPAYNHTWTRAATEISLLLQLLR